MAFLGGTACIEYTGYGNKPLAEYVEVPTGLNPNIGLGHSNPISWLHPGSDPPRQQDLMSLCACGVCVCMCTRVYMCVHMCACVSYLYLFVHMCVVPRVPYCVPSTLFLETGSLTEHGTCHLVRLVGQ